MKLQTVQTTFFFALLIGMAALIATMFLPFGNVIALSAVLALTFRPVFLWIRRRICFGHGTLASVLTLAVILAVIAGPLAFVGARVFDESKAVYESFDRDGENFSQTIERWIEAPVHAFAPGFQLDVRAYASSVFRYLGEHTAAFLSGALSVVASIALQPLAGNPVARTLYLWRWSLVALWFTAVILMILAQFWDYWSTLF